MPDITRMQHEMDRNGYNQQVTHALLEYAAPTDRQPFNFVTDNLGHCQDCGWPISYERFTQDFPPEGYKCDQCGKFVCSEHSVRHGSTGPVYCTGCEQEVGHAVQEEVEVE